MPELIPPRDTITITIYNLEDPPRVDLAISRNLPFPLVVGFISAVLQSLSAQVWNQLAAPLSATKAPAKYPAKYPAKE